MTPLSELAPHGRRTRQMLALRSGLSRPMMSKLETIGRRAELMRRVAGSPSAFGGFTLHPGAQALVRIQPGPDDGSAQQELRRDQGALRFALARQAEAQAHDYPGPLRAHPLARRLLIADITSALDRIIETRKIDLEISLPPDGTEGAAHDGASAECARRNRRKRLAVLRTRLVRKGEACERDNGQGDDDRFVDRLRGRTSSLRGSLRQASFRHRPGAVAHEPRSEPPCAKLASWVTSLPHHHLLDHSFSPMKKSQSQNRRR